MQENIRNIAMYSARFEVFKAKKGYSSCDILGFKAV